jgi:hypothetical protein
VNTRPQPRTALRHEPNLVDRPPGALRRVVFRCSQPNGASSPLDVTNGEVRDRLSLDAAGLRWWTLARSRRPHSDNPGCQDPDLGPHLRLRLRLRPDVLDGRPPRGHGHGCGRGSGVCRRVPLRRDRSPSGSAVTRADAGIEPGQSGNRNGNGSGNRRWRDPPIPNPSPLVRDLTSHPLRPKVLVAAPSPTPREVRP